LICQTLSENPGAVWQLKVHQMSGPAELRQV